MYLLTVGCHVVINIKSFSYCRLAGSNSSSKLKELAVMVIEVTHVIEMRSLEF